ncbi:hypothetical protein DL770_010975 [Monosporascus sp. CRB-9-2]|nr:hypothetical protein DL770_010975 [Monosporascus sp. CRB-9-2]
MLNSMEKTIRGYLGLTSRQEDIPRPAGLWPGKSLSPSSDDSGEPDTGKALSPRNDQQPSMIPPDQRRDDPRESTLRATATPMPPPQSTRPKHTLPTQPPKPTFEPKYKPRPAVGDQRAQAMVEGRYNTPYRWVGDTYETVAQRPEPYFPQGWPGWPKYKASIVEQEEEDKAQKERERAKQREDLARRRGRSPELRKLEDKPRRR